MVESTTPMGGRTLRSLLLLICILVSSFCFWCFDLEWQRGGGLIALIVAFAGWGLCIYCKTRFKQLRFRTADLLVLVTVAAVILGFVAKFSRVRKAERELMLLRQQGAVIVYEVEFSTPASDNGYFVSHSGRLLPNWTAQLLGKSYFSPIKRISFTSTEAPLVDEDVSRFASLPSFQSLNLTNTSITSTGLQNMRLRSPQQLEILVLRTDQLDEDAAKYLRSRFSNLQKIIPSTNKIVSDTDTARLRYFNDVRRLVLLGKGITNQTIENLSHVADLNYLTVGDINKPTRVTTDGLAKIHTLTDLDHLTIHRVTALKLADFLDLRHLEELRFDACRFAQPDFRTLRRVPKLRLLSVRGTPLSEAEVRAISDIHQLQSLNLQNWKIPIECLRLLTRLPRLQELHLTGVSINEETIEIFRQMRSLHGIAINRVKNGQQAAARLVKALPHLDAVRINGASMQRQMEPNPAEAMGMR